MLEIERKFLINNIPDISTCEQQEILQWYTIIDKKKIRVREIITKKKGKTQKKYFLTRKKGKGLVREEFEKTINKKDFIEYRKNITTEKIKKTRYFYPYKGYNIEINKFEDNLEWLRIAEIEFWSVRESEKFIPPERCYKEITNQKEGNNSFLAKHWMNRLIKKNKYQDIIIRFQLKEFYNQEALKYSQTRKKYRNDADIIINTIASYPEKQIRIVELWCGSWRLLEHLTVIKDKIINYTWIDLSENILEEAKKNQIPQKNIKTEFICDDMIGYLSKCKQESIDIIVGIASIQHLTNKKQRFLIMKLIYRALRYGWVTIITNRSFSLRMIKNYTKIILKSFLKKLINPNNNERNNLFIPRKSKNKTYYRFYHIFTKKELKKICIQSWLLIEKLIYTNKQWEVTNTWKTANNTILIAKKNIFTL